jgi:hypothetical protein
MGLVVSPINAGKQARCLHYFINFSFLRKDRGHGKTVSALGDAPRASSTELRYNEKQKGAVCQ